MSENALARIAILKHLQRLTNQYPLQHPWDLLFEGVESSGRKHGRSNHVYEGQFFHCFRIESVQAFWETFNNVPFENLSVSESLHLFQPHVKPVWEDKHNVNGGCWTIRVSKSQSVMIFHQLCLLAIGGALEDAVVGDDDVFGISLSCRATSDLLMLWTKTAENLASMESIFRQMHKALPHDTFRDSPQNYYFKAHHAHANFGRSKMRLRK